MSIKDEYYKAYEERYAKVHKNNMLWQSSLKTKEVEIFIKENLKNKEDKILDLGSGEGRDAINLLSEGYNVLAVDYSASAIEKCNQLTNNQYVNSFKQFDLIKDKLIDRFSLIYSVAVLHMFVLNEHRNTFLKFISEHLEENGKALICVLGDGEQEYQSNIDEAFNKSERIIQNNNEKITVTKTSCRIVNWHTLREEIKKSDLIIEKEWISNDIPEFSSSMCVVVSKR